MHFAFSDDQLAFRDAVRDFLVRECPPSVVRSAWNGEPSQLWPQLADMGVVGLTVPEAMGGLGMDDLDLVLIMEETGRAGLPEPLVETTAVVAPLLAAIGGTVAAEHLPGIADGSTIAVMTFGAEYAPWADRAGLVVRAAADTVELLSPDAYALVPQANVDAARPLFALDPRVLDGGPVLASGPAAAALAGAARDRGALAVAAQLCGLAARMLDITVEYVKERKQFGVPIGSYQAVKHHLANVELKLAYARPVVYRAAWSRHAGDPLASVHCSMAKVYASEAASVAVKACLQCHGAIAYTLEHDLHLFMKRVWALLPAYGDARWHQSRVATHVLG